MTKEAFIQDLNDKLDSRKDYVETVTHNGAENASNTTTLQNCDLWLTCFDDGPLCITDFPELTKSQFSELIRLCSEFNDLCKSVNGPALQATSDQARKSLLDIARLVKVID